MKIVLFCPWLSKLGAVVNDAGTCNLTCRAGRDEKQQESHSEAHKLPRNLHSG